MSTLYVNQSAGAIENSNVTSVNLSHSENQVDFVSTRDYNSTRGWTATDISGTLVRITVNSVTLNKGYQLANYSGQSGPIKIEWYGYDTKYITVGTQGQVSGPQGQAVYVHFNTAPITYTISYSGMNNATLPSGSYNISGDSPKILNPKGSVDYDIGYLKTEVPTRTGYTFNGFTFSNLDTSTALFWYNGGDWTHPSSNTLSLNKTQSTNLWYQNLRSSSGAVTITAKWTANTYTVTLNKQNGSGGSSSVTATYGSAMPSINIPSKSGYSFGGYYTNTGGSGTQYYNASGASVRNWDLTSATTLYAYWIDSDPPYNTVSGGYNKKATSQTVTLSATDNEGVTKYYWGTSSTGSMSTTYSGSITQTVSSSGTRYFRTKDAAGNTASTPVEFIQYKVQNVLQKSSGTAGTYTSANYETNGNLNTYIIRPTTTYPDYIYNAPSNSTFKGWSTSFSTSKANLSTSQISLSSGTTYYMWFDRDTYTVQYNNNGGSGTMENSIATYGANFITRPNTFTKSGYSFNGWNESADGTGVPWKLTSSGVYENENGAHPWVWTYTQGITLYAQWVVNEKPGVHINVSGLFQLAAPYIFCKRGTETTASWHKMAPYVWDGSTWRLCGEKGASTPSQPEVVKFSTITIKGSDTVAQNGTTYTISASPTNAANQSVTVSLTGNGYFDSNTSTISKNITLVNGTKTVLISSKARTAGTQGVITATPAVAQTSGLKATKDVIYEATKFTTLTVSPDNEQTIAYHGTKTFTVTATPSYAGPQYVYLYDATASAGYTSISGNGVTAGSYTLNSQNTSAVCQYKLTLTNGVGSFIVTNNSSSTADEHGAVFVYTVLPSSTNTVELSASTGILTLSTNPDAQLTLQSFSDSFDVWRTGSTVNSRWLYANSTTAIPKNTNLPVLSDSDTTTGIQVQGKSLIAGGTADVDLDLTLQNAVLTHTPEEINTINIICQTTMTNGSTTNYYSFKITMNNQESSVISDLTSSNGRVSTYAPSVSFTDAQKTAIVNAIKSSSNGKTFSLVNTVHGHANYTFSGTVNVQLLSLSIVIGYKAYA